MVSIMAWNARDEGSITALSTIFPVFITSCYYDHCYNYMTVALTQPDGMDGWSYELNVRALVKSNLIIDTSRFLARRLALLR